MITRKVNSFILPAVVFSFLVGCSSIQKLKTEAEQSSGYTYIPLDPLPIDFDDSDSSCSLANADKKLVNALPDNAVRMSVQSFDADGNITYGTK